MGILQDDIVWMHWDQIVEEGFRERETLFSHIDRPLEHQPIEQPDSPIVYT